MSYPINNALNIPLFGKLGQPIYGVASNPVYGDYIFGTRIYVCFGYNNLSVMPYDYSIADYVDPLAFPYPLDYIGSEGLPAHGFVAGDFTGYEFIRSLEFSLKLSASNTVVAGTFTDHAFAFSQRITGKAYDDFDGDYYLPSHPDADVNGIYHHTGLGLLPILDETVKFGTCVYSDTYGILATDFDTGTINNTWNFFQNGTLTGFKISWAPVTPELSITNY